jgi:predicted transcriptional regulator
VKRSAKKATGSLADEVLQYLVNHERADDTVEGIVAWWFPVDRIRIAISEVEAALQQLVISGFVIARKTPDGGIHYCMNPREKQAIRRRLGMKAAGAHQGVAQTSKARKKNGAGDR